MKSPEQRDHAELLKAAYRKMSELRAQLSAAEDQQNEPVAIVGMSCRMPGGFNTPDAYWQMLLDGVDGITPIPADRWDIDDYYDPDPDAPNKMYVRQGGFVDNFRDFDPLFFRVPPAEAASMDPQLRLLLETSWEAVEDAGWSPDELAGTKTGVFVGTSSNDFGHIAVMAMSRDGAHMPMAATGISPSIKSGYPSYFLGLHGPSLALDTACSSALAAIHMGCESLRRGECTAALAGAVNLILSPEGNVVVCKARMLSPDGYCKSFDASADGYVRSEGCGMIVLKLLSKAQADGDRIVSVIRGSAWNQDGRTNGITAPSGNAQREVIQTALAAASVSASEIGYIETHGTGTSLGDPIEVQALGEVFGPGRPPESKVVLGAAKSNVGHLECAAGIAGIIKTAYVLQTGVIPPNLHFKNPNPHAPWAQLPFVVPTELMHWPEGDTSRKAGLSSFGFSGTNVHMVLEQPPAPAVRAVTSDAGSYLLALSGKTAQARADLARRYVDFFDRNPDADLGDVCFTAAAGRAHFAFRLATVADSIAAMRARLADFLAEPEREGGWAVGTASSRAPNLGLVIGEVSAAMVAPLAEHAPAYREAFDACEKIAATLGFGLADDKRAAAFARAYATAACWLAWGVTPAAMSGIGESLLAAAAVAGAITLEDALLLTRDPAARAGWSTPAIPLFSPLDGQPLTVDAMRRSVSAERPERVADIAARMAGEGVRLVLALSADEPAAGGTPAVIAAGDGGWAGILDAMSKLYARGVALGWARIEAPWRRRRVALPTYPFQRQDLGPDLTANRRIETAPAAAGPSLHPLLERRLHSAFRRDAVFESTFTATRPALLADHKFYSTVVVSMSTLLEMALAGGRMAAGGEVSVENVVVEQPLLVPANAPRLVHVVFTPSGRGFDFTIMSADSASLDQQPDWERHCAGEIVHLAPAVGATIDPEQKMREYAQSGDPAWFYDTTAQTGVDYGPSFRTLASVGISDKAVFAKVAFPGEGMSDASDFAVHPGLLDAAIQAFGFDTAMDTSADEERKVYMPVGIERYALARPAGDGMWCDAVVRSSPAPDAEGFIGDVRLFDLDGVPIGELAGVRFRRTSRQKLTRNIRERQLNSWLYEPQWERLSAMPAAAGGGGRHWLVIGDDASAAGALAERLRGGGATTALARRSDYTALLRDDAAGGRPDAIAYLATSPAEDGMVGAARDHTLDVLDLVHAIQRGGITDLASLALVTRGFRTPSVADAGALAGGAIWGLGRVVASELSEFNCRLYDLDAATSLEDGIDRLAAELLAPSSENQVAFDRNDRLGLRLKPAELHEGETLKLAAGPVKLDMGARGDFRNLRFVPQEAVAPRPNDVQLRVLATAMNFRDVLNVLGMYPGDPGEPGVECFGEIVALGDGVSGLALGDRVLAIPRKGYATYADAACHMVFKAVDHLSVAENATLLVAYLTATYTLNHLGRMQRGERVLIHAGAGGVGLAAIQLAQRAGLEVFATAGSPVKRDYLKRIGVDHVFDSRSLDFAEQIRTITRGEGIDLVLNSLTDAMMEQSLRLLRKGGRFLELGRIGVYTPDEASAINADASHAVIELLEPFETDPGLMQALFDDVRDGLTSGELRPLNYKTFGLDELPRAFRYMEAARHIGKIVVIDRSAEGYRAIEPSGTYLVTGGLGGLGLVCARWLAEQGARSLILVGRSAPGPDARAAIAEIEAMGASVHVAQADIGDRDQIADVLAKAVSPTRPLRGVIHSAGVIDDGLITAQDHGRFEKVMRPKIDGGWLLHELTLKSPLEFFVLFSSGAGLFGNPGQSAYAAASVFLDGLARARRNGGLPALSIDWGPWAEVGMAARMGQGHARDWDAQGLASIGLDDGLTVLRMLLGLDRYDQVAVLPFDRGRLSKSTGPVPPFLSALIDPHAETAVTALPSVTERAAAPVAALPLDAIMPGQPQSQEDIERFLLGVWQDLLGVQTISIDDDYFDLGGHSLLTAKMISQLERAYDRTLSAALIVGSPTIRQLAQAILELPPLAAGPHLFTFRAGDDTPPLIIMPSMAGTSMHFRQFVEDFDSPRPFAGIYIAGEPDYTKQTTIEEVCAQCAQAISAAYPDRPCHLIGYSFGGTLALEVGRQLRALGHPTGVVVIVDRGPNRPIAFQRVAWPATTNFVARGRMALRGGTIAQKLHTVRWATRMINKRSKGHDMMMREIILGEGEKSDWSSRIISWFSDMRVRYEQQTYDGDVLLVRAEKRPLLGPFGHDLGWSEFVRGRVEVAPLEGDHNNILVSDRRLKLVAILKKRLPEFDRPQRGEAGTRALKAGAPR